VGRVANLRPIANRPSDGAQNASNVRIYDTLDTNNQPMASPSPNLLKPGDALGPYRIDALIGKGGMGEVYRGTDTRLGRPVAV
jgi:serine/threonine protein kinase